MTKPKSLLDQPTVYGQRAKLGVIVPPTNTSNEAEWNQLVPTGVSVHAARMPLHADSNTPAGRQALYRDVERYAADLASAAVSVIAYGCTAGSMFSPVSALAGFITAQTGIPALSTAEALVVALRQLEVQRVAVATPYHAALNAHECEFLGEQGFDVVAIDGLGYGANGPDEYRNIARIPVRRVVEFARQVDCDDAQAVILSCTDLATLEAIPVLEKVLRKPVVSSNSATFWLALRRAGIADSIGNAGSLLERN